MAMAGASTGDDRDNEEEDLDEEEEDDDLDEELVFNVEEPQEAATTNWVTYRHFIERLRRSFPYVKTRRAHDTFDIVLTTNSCRIKLRLIRSCFTPVAYQIQAPQQWIDAAVETVSRCRSRCWRGYSGRRTDWSTFRGMYDSYEELESECMQTIETICLSQQQLTSAVNLLAISSCSSQDRARSLIIIILMISEGGKFSCFSDYLAARFLDDVPVPRWMSKTLRYYGFGANITKVSQCIGPASKNPDSDPDPFPTMNIPIKMPGRVDSGLRLREDGAKESPDHHHPRGMGPCEDVFDISPDVETSDVGSPMSLQSEIRTREHRMRLPTFSEVFFMRISTIEGKHSGHLFGKIYVGRYSNSQCIYSRSREEPEFIQPGDLVSLTNSWKPINANDQFFFAFALMGESFQIDLPFHTRTDKYNEPICDEYYGEYCSVTVCYIALRGVMYATLWVTFIDKDSEGHAHVYGQLSARCGNFGYEIVLFQKKAEEYIDAHPGQPIRLLRNVVCVPWNSRLVLRANLFEYVDACFDQEIAKGVMEFPLHNKSGSFEEIMD